MRTLVLINSLSHSGSTVLSMVLSGHDKLVSLGEIFQVLREDPHYWLDNTNATCSCGAKASKCKIWGAALQEMVRDTKPDATKKKYDSISDRYQILLKTFAEVYGNDTTAIDTSKGFRHLQMSTEDPKLDIRLIFLMRDARAYATSQTRIARTQQRKGLRKFKQSAAFQLLKWYYCNRRRQKHIQRHNLNAVQMSYESLCFHSEETVQNICNTLGIDYQKKMICLSDSRHHILQGNSMRLNQKKQASLSYDSRWQGNHDWAAPYSLFGRIRRYNQDNITFNIDNLD